MSIIFRRRNAHRLCRLPLRVLMKKADLLRARHKGDSFELCAIVNAKSGLCAEDCRFCAQSSRYDTGAPVYPLKTPEDIVAQGEQAAAAGVHHFSIVTSGTRPSAEELNSIARAIRMLRRRISCTLCASLGSLGKEELRFLKDAGLAYYHHNIESSARFYPSLVSTHTFKERLATIQAARHAGLTVCSGVLLGAGESWHDRIDMAYLLRDLKITSIPVNILIPVPGTPLAGMQPLACRDILKTIALFRIINKHAHLRIVAGRETMLHDFQGAAFLAGANGMFTGGYLTRGGRARDDDAKLAGQVRMLFREALP